MPPVLHNSDGSAEWISERSGTDPATHVICSVNGPLEVKHRDELPTQATLELVVRPATGLTTIREVLLQDQIYATLESVILRKLHPRSLIQIVLQILEPGEPVEHTVYELAAGINTAVLALANAGISLSGLVAATTLVVIGGTITTTPSLAELASATSTHVVAFAYKRGPENPEQRLVMCESLGRFSEGELLHVLEAAEPACLKVYSDLRGRISTDVLKSSPWTS